MKNSIIFAALIGILAVTGISQSLPSVPVYSIVVDRRSDLSEINNVVIQYTGLENPNLLIFEAVLPAPTQAACLASRDFSDAVPVGPDRAALTYDAETSKYRLQWSRLDTDARVNCRVLIVRSEIGVGDLAVWQSNYGQTALFEDVLVNGKLSSSDAAARPVTRVGSTYTVLFGGNLSGLAN
jgi:hypothetical protein